MNRPLTLALDLDGVVVDLSAEIMRRLRDEGHVCPDWTTPPAWHWADPACGFTAEAGMRAQELFRSVEAYETAPAMPGAVEAVKDIVAAGWRVVVVTARPYRARKATHNWLSAHGLGKLHVSLTSAKAALALANGYTVAIDDAPKQIEAYRAAGVPCIAWDAPYNREARALFRCDDWAEVLWHLGSIQAAVEGQQGRQNHEGGSVVTFPRIGALGGSCGR